MKRLIPALLALLMLMGSASAERTVVTALASEINPGNLTSNRHDDYSISYSYNAA